MINQSRLFEVLTVVETVFNVTDCLPAVGRYSGYLRTAAGKVEFLAGLVFLLIRAREQDQEKAAAHLKVSVELIAHGFLNFVRGALAHMNSLRGIPPMGFVVVSVLRNSSLGPWFEYGRFTKVTEFN